MSRIDSLVKKKPVKYTFIKYIVIYLYRNRCKNTLGVIPVYYPAFYTLKISCQAFSMGHEWIAKKFQQKYFMKKEGVAIHRGLHMAVLSHMLLERNLARNMCDIWRLPTNGLSLFDHFEWFAFKGLSDCNGTRDLNGLV